MTRPPPSVVASDEGLEITGGDDLRLDVHFDGRRVWSCLPSRDGRQTAASQYLVRWPKLLRPRLDGVATLEIDVLDTGQRLHCGEVSFGSGRGRVNLLDDAGRPLTLDKGNRLESSFATARPEEKTVLLDAVDRTMDILTERGVPAFLAFGCLLGAVREGQLIGHDNDADVSYLSSATHPFDVIAESLALERHFRQLGWRTQRMWAAFFKVYPPAGEVGVDVFAAFRHGDHLYMLPTVRAPLPTSTLVPVSTVTLEGRTLRAPADPPALLEATYGPGWRTPDPTFRFRPPLTTKRTLGAWMRGSRLNQRYWDDSYAVDLDTLRPEPSRFARWVVEQEPASSLLDIGCGVGRDSRFFAARGFDVLGCDYAPRALDHAKEQARQAGLSNVGFEHLNLYDLRHVLVRGALLARSTAPRVVYVHDVVDSLNRLGRRNLFLLSRTALRASGGRIYLQYRTERPTEAFGSLAWEYAAPDVVVEELSSYGFEVEHREEPSAPGQATADWVDVCRIVARIR